MAANEKKTLTQAEAAKKRKPAAKAKAAPKQSAATRNGKAATPKAAPKSAQQRAKVAKKAGNATKSGKTNSHPLMATNRDWDREAVMAIVLERIATSTKGLNTILTEGAEIDGKTYPLPTYSTIMKWLDDGETQEGKPSFSDRYARARDAQAHVMHDEILEIHKSALQPLVSDGEVVYGSDGKPVMVATSASVQMAKLEADNKKWLMSKLMPKKYGDRVDLNHGGQDGNPVTTVSKVIVVPAKEQAQVETRPYKAPED